MLTAADLSADAQLHLARIVYPKTKRREIRRLWLEEFGYRCRGGCDTVMTFELDPLCYSDQATIDHIVCRALGGSEALSNLRVICRGCNSRKSKAEQEDVAKARARDGARPCLHFVNFRGEEYWSAIRIWGRPHFIHPGWDRRAFREIAPGDTVVFARGTESDPPRGQNYTDFLEWV